jgi:hypothetical protein
LAPHDLQKLSVSEGVPHFGQYILFSYGSTAHASEVIVICHPPRVIWRATKITVTIVDIQTIMLTLQSKEVSIQCSREAFLPPLR